MNELMARSLSPKELAEEFRYHDDPGVSKLAKSLIDDRFHAEEAEEQIEEAERAAENAREEADGLEQERDDLKELLRDCREYLYGAGPDDTVGELINRITAVL